MRQAFILALGAIASVTSAAGAQGLYVGAGAGLQWEQGKTAQSGGGARIRTDGGDKARVAVGTRIGSFRIEGEVLRAGADNLGKAGIKRSWAGMANILYDFPVPARLGLHPYLGAGMGWTATSLDSAGASVGGSRGSSTWTGPAWQAILGVAIPTSLDGLLMTAEYRATAPIGREHFDFGSTGGRFSSSIVSHSILLGIRWEWDAGRMLAGTSAMASPAPRSMAAAVNSFSPKFESGSSTLTNEGRTAMEKASIAVNSAGVLVSVSGQGSPALAEKRAWAAVGELVKRGVPQQSIMMNGHPTGIGNTDGSKPEVWITSVP